MQLALSQAAAWLGDANAVDRKDAVITRVSTDSRTLAAGDLFFALQGERFDAHDFVAQAMDVGAFACVRRDFAAKHPQWRARLLAVDDTRLALGQLAKAWRRAFSLPVIAVTGSNGKTSLKDMLAAIFRALFGEDAVLATRGNLNNDIGLPLTLLALRAKHRVAIVEMGMNHAGELRYLSDLALPDMAVINNAARAHLGHFVSVAEIAAAKGEIIEGLSQDGVLLLNQDDDFYDFWRKIAEDRGISRILPFGKTATLAKISDEVLHVDGSDAQLALDRAALDRLDVAWATTCQAASAFPADKMVDAAALHLSVAGEHMLQNARAASLAAAVLGVSAAQIAAGLAQFRGSAGRLQVQHFGDQSIIDDSYNANPDSVRAAMQVLAKSPAPRVLILGDIGELGAFSAQEHAKLGQNARDFGVDVLLCLGKDTRLTAAEFGENGHFFGDDFNALMQTLRRIPFKTALVKGSRMMQMERVLAAWAAS